MGRVPSSLREYSCTTFPSRSSATRAPGRPPSRARTPFLAMGRSFTRRSSPFFQETPFSSSGSQSSSSAPTVWEMPGAIPWSWSPSSASATPTTTPSTRTFAPRGFVTTRIPSVAAAGPARGAGEGATGRTDPPVPGPGTGAGAGRSAYAAAAPARRRTTAAGTQGKARPGGGAGGA